MLLLNQILSEAIRHSSIISFILETILGDGHTASSSPYNHIVSCLEAVPSDREILPCISFIYILLKSYHQLPVVQSGCIESKIILNGLVAVLQSEFSPNYRLLTLDLCIENVILITVMNSGKFLPEHRVAIEVLPWSCRNHIWFGKIASKSLSKVSRFYHMSCFVLKHQEIRVHAAKPVYDYKICAKDKSMLVSDYSQKYRDSGSHILALDSIIHSFCLFRRLSALTGPIPIIGPKILTPPASSTDLRTISFVNLKCTVVINENGVRIAYNDAYLTLDPEWFLIRRPDSLLLGSVNVTHIRSISQIRIKVIESNPTIIAVDDEIISFISQRGAVASLGLKGYDVVDNIQPRTILLSFSSKEDAEIAVTFLQTNQAKQMSQNAMLLTD